MEWKVNIKGEPNNPFEISVIKGDHHGIKSWGWFDENKLLISHNGGPCRMYLTPFIFNKMVKLAEEIATELNNDTSGSISKP